MLVTRRVKSTDKTFNALAELTLVIGYYNLVACFSENTEVQKED